MRDSEALIEVLAKDMRPVDRVAPVWRRVMVWGPVALGLGFMATLMLHRFNTDWSSAHAAISVANVALSLTLGLAIFAASLSISVAGGRVRGKGWIVGGLAAWLVLAMVSMALSPRLISFQRGVGSYCFTFVLTAGAPMILVAIAALRRTRSLHPRRSLSVAGAGIAFMAFGLLGFCHPAEMSMTDFVAHLLAALVLGVGTVLAGRPLIRA
ncbi:NrsF family protein [Novosphingobium humi]|uniref:NrsF family protein n=1 Tax=Novosphingobium humi TaxID=2282397 RepID=UPI0025B1953B|nr:NrsF family protein [Novosphingobium humi]WJT00959.1 NrsF family protein [Novosphingobium humi]